MTKFSMTLLPLVHFIGQEYIINSDDTGKGKCPRHVQTSLKSTNCIYQGTFFLVLELYIPIETKCFYCIMVLNVVT